MAKPAFDADALITQFEQASAEGSAKLRKAVADATLGALQGRELTLKNIRAVLGAVTQAASAGLANNPAAIDADKLLDQAVAGMDDALLKAVDAHRVALQQLAAQGADLREKHLKKALADLDYETKMTSIFSESRRVLAEDGVLSVMFTHKRAEAWIRQT